MPSITKMAKALRMVQKHGTVRPRELVEQDIPADYLDRLYQRGLIDRIGPGLYTWPEAEVSEHHSLAAAARQVPSGIVCLLTALRFHGLTTQAPHEVWLAIPPKAWAPKVTSPKVRFVRFSGAALTELVEDHAMEGTAVRVTTPAITVADCFKYRNKVGIDMAIDALRDCWRSRRATMDELWAAARVCRMANVIRPYLESLV